jgi:serine/threonine protein kinase
MDLNKLCMGCMEVKGDVGLCPFCGYKEGTKPELPLHLMPRTIISKKYLLGKVLGQGGFGITYLAWDIYLDRKLAVKEYFPRDLAYREKGEGAVSIYSRATQSEYDYGLDKFMAEGKTLAKLEGHPNIVAIKDFFKSNDTAYLVMNYVEGISLADYLNRLKEQFSFEQALQIFMPVLDAVKAIHQTGLLHRDISPDNIYITVHGRVILLDFGAARHALGEKGKNLSIILKPGYAPEEQYRSKGAQGPWTDIYAIAVTIYQAITGRMPPDALDRLNGDSIIAPSELSADISAEQEMALMKALAVKAEDRYQTVEEFQDALKPLPQQKVDTWKPSEQNIVVPVDYPREPAKEEYHQDQHSDEEYKGMDEFSEEVVTEPVYEEPEVYVDQQKEPYFEEQQHSFETGSMEHHEPYYDSQYEPIISDVISIGRSNDNDMVLHDATVSRHHARIYRKGDKWFIEDLNSTYGTSVNSNKISGLSELVPNSVIQISGEKITFDGHSLRSAEGHVLRNLVIQAPEPVYHKPAVVQKKSNLVPVLIALLAIGVLAIGLLFLSRDSSSSEKTPEPVEVVIPQESKPEDVFEHGTITYEGGTYIGQLKNGVPHGYGTITYRSASDSSGFSQIASMSGAQKYSGNWEEGKKHGKGTMTYSDGRVSSGLWENDHFKGSNAD